MAHLNCLRSIVLKMSQTPRMLEQGGRGKLQGKCQSGADARSSAGAVLLCAWALIG